MSTVLDLERLSPLWTNRPADVPADARLAPMPPTDPIVGHMRAGLDPMGTFLRWRHDYGDVVRARFGTMTVHLVSDPHLIETMLKTKHRIYGKDTRGNRQLKLLLGEGLLTAHGDHWLRQRRIAQPAFHRKRIEAFSDVMVEAGEKVGGEFVPGEVFDVNHAMMRATLDVVSRTMFGTGVSEREAELVGAAVDFVTAAVQRRLRTAIAPPLSVPTKQNREFKKHRENLDRIVYRFIEQRRGHEDESDDLLSLLMRARDPETGERMTDEQLRDEVLTIFLAGHETTANALTWTFYLLSKHPEVARRLWAELDGVLDGRGPTVDDLPKLVYTRQVIDESMRLFPPAWTTARSPSQDEELGGYFIPKGSLVFSSMYVVHRHPDYWEDPEGFDPDRFAPGKKLSHRFAYFPFGGGPRLCIGQRFAINEAVLILAALARRYRLDLVPGHEPVLDPAITLRPKYGLKMVAYPR